MNKTGKTTPSIKQSSSSRRLSSAIKTTGTEELRTELNRCKAELVCLRAKFNVADIEKNRIEEWSTEQMFQQSLINVEAELKKFMDSSGDALRDQNMKLTKENTELKKSSKYLQEEITVLKHRCKSLDLECQRLKDDYESKQGQIPDTKDYNAALEEIQHLRDTVKQKEEQLVTHLVDQRNRATQQSQYDKLVKDLTRERAERQQLEEELREKVRENQTIAAELRKLEGQLREQMKQSQNNTQDETIKHMEKDRDEKAKEIHDLHGQLESMRASLANVKSSADDKSSLERILAETKSQLNTVKAEIDKLRDTHLIEMNKLKETLSQYELDMAAIRAELETWKATSQSLTAENRALKNQLQEPSSNNIDISPELKELKQKYETEKAAHMRTKNQKEELEIRCHDAFEKINQKEKLLKTQENNHKEVIARKDKTIGELRRERTMVNPGSDNSKQELQAMKEKLEFAMKEMKDIKTEYEMLKKLRD